MELTILIKTFQRKSDLWNLLESIAKYYSCLPIIIVDDSKRKYKEQTLRKFNHLDIDYLSANHDIGLSKGRNLLIQNTKTKYFLLCDDDFVFDGNTNLDLALELLKNNNLDILAGTVKNYFKLNSIYSFMWMLKKPSRIFNMINQVPIESVYNGKFKLIKNQKDRIELRLNRNIDDYSHEEFYRSDIVNNFFIARTKSIQSLNGWQPEEIKISEHQLFFLRTWENRLNVAYSNKFSIRHYPRKSIFYMKFRNRGAEYFYESFRRYGLKEYVGYDVNLNKTLYHFNFED